MQSTLGLDALADLRYPSDVALSPDGEQVAFAVTESDAQADETRTSLFVAPTDGSADPHRLTRVGDAEAPAWSPTGDRLAFLATRERDVELSVTAGADGGGESGGDGKDRDGGEGGDATDDPKRQVWVLDVTRGGDARQVTDFEEGVAGFDWGPDGDRLAVAARDPTDEQRESLESRRDGGPIELTRIQQKVDGQGWQDDVRTYLFVVDVATREADRLDDAYARGARAALLGFDFSWGPDERIAFVSYRGDDPDQTYAQDVYTVASDGSDLRRVTDGGIAASKPRWSPDGRRLAFVAGDATNACIPDDVHVADVGTEGGDVRSVSSSLDRMTLDAPRWVASDRLLARVADGARARLVALDANADDPVRVFEAQGDGRTVTGFDAAASRTAVAFSHPNEGEDVFAADTDALLENESEPRRLSRLNEAALDGVALPSCERITFENGDGEEIEAIVHLPANFDPADPDPRPTIAHIHGGPMSFDAPRFEADYAYWTGRGYVVCNVNYRGGTSYGRAFTESIRGRWGPREADDIVSGVDELVAREWADPDRLFVSGFSQGGINTLHVVTRTDKFAAAAPEHGIYDFLSNFGTADMHQWYVNDYGYPWEVPEAYRDISTIQHVDDIDTPLLITAGEADWRCPPSQAEQLYASVSRAGVDAKLVVYPEEHHTVGDPKRAEHRLRTLTEWFEAHDVRRNAEGDAADGA